MGKRKAAFWAEKALIDDTTMEDVNMMVNVEFGILCCIKCTFFLCSLRFLGLSGSSRWHESRRLYLLAKHCCSLRVQNLNENYLETMNCRQACFLDTASLGVMQPTCRLTDFEVPEPKTARR